MKPNLQRYPSKNAYGHTLGGVSLWEDCFLQVVAAIASTGERDPRTVTELATSITDHAIAAIERRRDRTDAINKARRNI